MVTPGLLSTPFTLGRFDTTLRITLVSTKYSDTTSQILGNSSGQFANTDYGPELRERRFFIFPYDIRHCVYPFNNTNDVRRTLACNMDVEYNPVKNRSA